MDRVRVGVIGYGYWGPNLIRNFTACPLTEVAAVCDADPARLRSNTFSLEWPPKSGRQQEFPEADRAAWFPLGPAAQKSVPGQRGFFAELARLLS